MMDFLDPKQRRAHDIRLLVGYVLIAVALTLATTVLLYQANGFGVKSGKVIQNGLVFVSSNPGPATIQLNGQAYKDTTNTRMVLPAGTYTMRLSREGYRDWQRGLTVEGGSVEHFDYPLLIPNSLSATKLTDYEAAPTLATQSPNRRWLLVQQPATPAVLEVYDIKDPKKTQTLKTTITLPASILSVPDGATLNDPQSFVLQEWSNDNDHVVLKHLLSTAGDRFEYILVSRKAPDTSVNLTRQLQLNATTTLTLQDKKFDRFFTLDSANAALTTRSLDNNQSAPVLEGVLAYETYGSGEVLYASASGVPSDKAAIRLLHDGQTYNIRQVTRSPSYLLALSQYANDWYITAGVSGESHVYVYRNPATALQKESYQALVPVDVIKLTNPSYVAISDNSQMIGVESGQDFSVYDAENDRSHTYHIDKPLDAPQSHATWMDGSRWRLVSRGSVVIFDYDGTNLQTLQSASAAYQPFFDAGYTYSYSLGPVKNTGTTGTSSAFQLDAVPLRLPADL